jgi:hypothetical protein
MKRSLEMKPVGYLALLLLVAGVTLSAVSCGSLLDDATDDSSLTETEDTDATDVSTLQTTNLNGMVVMGPVEGATVWVYVLNDDGTRGDLITSTTTDADGKYTFDEEITGPVAIVVTGGTYVDEATGDTVVIPDGIELMTLLAESKGRTSVGVTALTTIASARASANASIGLAKAIEASNKDVAVMFGLDGVDIVTVTPDDLTDENAADVVDVDSDETGHGLIIAAFTQMGKDSGYTAKELLDLLENFADDYSDGTLDGRKNGEALKNVLDHTPEQALKGLAHAVNNFLDGEKNNSGIRSEDWANRHQGGNSGGGGNGDDDGDSTDGSTGTDDTTATE